MRSSRWWIFLATALILVPSGAFWSPFSGDAGQGLQAMSLYSVGDDDDTYDWIRPGNDEDDQCSTLGDDDDDGNMFTNGDDWDDDHSLQIEPGSYGNTSIVSAHVLSVVVCLIGGF